MSPLFSQKLPREQKTNSTKGPRPSRKTDKAEADLRTLLNRKYEVLAALSKTLD